MKLKLDPYSTRARLFPVYLTIAPMVLLLVGVVPGALKLPLGGAAALIFAPIAYFMSQFGGDFGKRLEQRLWSDWGGPPTTRFLRHSNCEFNQVSRERVHAKLRAIGLHVPSEEEQQEDPRRADEHYESFTEELIRRTRDSARFPLVFKALTEYGFRRNLLGLRWYGRLLSAAAVLACGWNTVDTWIATRELPGVVLAAGLISLGLFLSWVIYVNEKAVRLTANRYARFLLEAALNLE